MSHSFAPRAQKLVRKLCLELLKSSKKFRCADLPLRGPLRGGLVSERTRCLSVRFYSPGNDRREDPTGIERRGVYSPGCDPQHPLKRSRVCGVRVRVQDAGGSQLFHGV